MVGRQGRVTISSAFESVCIPDVPDRRAGEVLTIFSFKRVDYLRYEEYRMLVR